MVKIDNPVVLCGYERGGTTLLSEILAQNGYQSGFECGVLLCNTPRDFKNLKPYFDEFPNWWKIPKTEVIEIIHSENFMEFYRKAIEKSGCFQRGFQEKIKFFDKTPIYMSNLGLVMSNLNFSSKVIVIHRDPRSVFVSWAKRQIKTNQTVEQFILKNITTLSKRYLHYFSGSIFHKQSPNVLFISFEHLCLDIENHLNIIGHFLDGRKYQTIKGPVRYSNVTSNKIDIAKVNEYAGYISNETSDLILETNKLASKFFSTIDDQIKYGNLFLDKEEAIMRCLKNFDISESHIIIENEFFDPKRYLLRYSDVLDAKLNPIKHWKNHGKHEGRLPC